MKTLNTKSYRMGFASGGSMAVGAAQRSARTPEEKKNLYIRIAIMIVAACIFVFAGSQIFMIFYRYHESDKIYSNVSNEVLNNQVNSNLPPIFWHVVEIAEIFTF